LVIVGKVHVDFVCYFFLKLSNADISENLRFLARCVRRHSGRIEREQQNDEGKDYWRYAHGFLHHRKKIARTRKPSRTPSNGLETANQKETFQSEVVEFIFTLFSQAFESRHFTEREISFETLKEIGTHLINREWVR
jgi:hypothetical protein